MRECVGFDWSDKKVLRPVGRVQLRSLDSLDVNVQAPLFKRAGEGVAESTTSLS